MYYNNFNNQFGMGMVPNQQQTMPKTGNWLSAEKYALLQKRVSQFKLSVTEEELAKGQCNHYYSNGSSALVNDQDGSGGCTCAICGTHFTSRDFSQQDVENATQNVLDILNTIKIMYLSLDPNTAIEYFQIIPFIEKIPQLYNIACADFRKYEGVDSFVPGAQQNPFNIFNMMINPGFGMQQPMYPNNNGFNMGQPGTPVQPQNPQTASMYPNGGFAQMNPQYGNPLYAAPATPGYVPQSQGYSMNAQGAAAPTVNTNMPVQPHATQASPVEAPVTVDTQFKK